MALRIAVVWANRGRHAAFPSKQIVAEAGKIADVDLAVAKLNKTMRAEGISQRIRGRRYFTKPSIERESRENRESVNIFKRGWRKKVQLIEKSK